MAAFGKGRSAPPRYVPVKVGHGFSVYDLHTKLWLQRQVQLRVSSERHLPVPLMSGEHGAFLHCTDFDPGGCGTGNLSPEKFVVLGGYRVWQWKSHINKDDLNGKRGFGITVDQVDAAGRSVQEPMEIFAFPAIVDQTPNEWSGWEKHTSQRHGNFAWWSQVQGRETEECLPVPYPCEMRWRLLLTDTPGRCVDDETIEM